MKQVFEKIKQRITIAATEACGYAALTRVVSEAEVKEILDSVVAEYNNGWIPCSERLPPEPNTNNTFDKKPVYLASVNGEDYPYRALWNGRYFMDGFLILEAVAWMPLPEPYKQVEK